MPLLSAFKNPLMLIKLKIRGKLLLTFLVLLIPTLLLTDLLWINSMRPLLRETVIRSQRRLAQNAVSQISAFMNERIAKLYLVSRDIDFLASDLSLVQLKMQSLLQLDNSLQEISLINLSGQELVKIDRNKAYLDKELTNVKESQEFASVTYRYGLEYVSQVYFSKQNEPILTVAVPIIMPSEGMARQTIIQMDPTLKQVAGETIIGIVSAKFNLSKLFVKITNNKTGKNEYLYIVDEKNKIISHTNSDLVKNSNDVSSLDIIQEHTKADEKVLLEQGTHPSDLFTTHQGLSEIGVEVLATYVHVPFLFWGVVVEQQVDDAFAFLYNTERFAIILFIVGLVATIVVSFWFAHRFASPIRILQEGAQIIGKGDLSHRLAIKSSDEIGQLAEGFNQMADSLSKSIEEIKQKKAIIEVERNELKSIIQSITDGVCVVDSNRNIILLNQVAEKMLGWQENKVAGQSLDKSLTLLVNSKKISVDEICPVIPNFSEKYPIIHKEAQLVRQDKNSHEPLYVNLVSSALLSVDAKNEFAGCVIVLHDITKERKLEEMKLDFVSIAAHELRTPLTVIKGFLSVFISENMGVLSNEGKEFILKIKTHLAVLGVLVENLLNISKVEQGSLALNIVILDWVDNVKEVVNDFTERASNKKLTLEMMSPVDKTISLSVDKIRINEVLSNLLTNAINYTKDGDKITVSIEKNDHEVITHITDTGIGIPADEIGRLFIKFYQVSSKFSENAQGTGLGLYISKSIVELHHGKIWVNSQLGKGSTFSFSLPIINVAKQLVKSS